MPDVRQSLDLGSNIGPLLAARRVYESTSGAPQFLRGALFRLKNALEPKEKGTPPTYVFCLLFPTAVEETSRLPSITTAILPRS